MADHAAASAAADADPSLRQGGDAADADEEEEEEEAAPSSAAGVGVGVGVEERCRAMMEVVKKDAVGGKWRVSKLVAAAVPVMGMEFESVHAAKGFYYGYGERVGFKARTGSNRRSVGNGVMIMQRFLCSRGNYANRRNKANGLDELKEEEVQDGAAGKRKRGANNKRNPNPVKNNSEVIEVESSAEKGVGTAVPNNGQEARKMRGSKRGRTKKDVTEKDEKPVVELEAEKEDEVVAQDGDDVEEQKGEGEEEMEEEVQVEVQEKRGRGRPRKADAEGNALQARVLRELGLRASQYTNEERKKIVSKYLSKRQSRPVSARPAKIASHQALAERRKRGDGGRFLSSEGLTQPSERRSKRLEKQNLKKEDKGESKEDEIIEGEPDPEMEVVAGPGGEPKVGMVFLNEDKAYDCYVTYAGTVGFSVRKGWLEKTATNTTKSRAYVCSKEGFRSKSVSTDPKKPRPETRTGCLAHMTIKITVSGKYVVTEYVADHNHDLETPLVDIQVLRSHKLLAKLQQPPDPPRVVLIPNDYKNYVRTRHTKDMQLGDTQAIYEYLQRKKGEHPSFFYAIQVDEDDQLTNVFWADVKSILDYHYFGDVLCVDTRYSTSDHSRPLLLFIGVNHHKQPVIFGAALVYDESVESFKWLFETFKSAMSGKQPKTVMIDQSTAISEAVASVWPRTTQRFSLIHLYKNATKILRDAFQASETFADDFSMWLYGYEEEGDFLSSWEILSDKYNLKDNEWLGKLYADRERWALPYGRDSFCADIAAALRSDNNTDAILADLLKKETDFPSFFNNYDKLLENKRLAEQQADYLGVQMAQRVAPLRMLWQAANAYTPTLFEMFRLEFELTLTCMAYCCGEIGPISEYEVTVKNRPRDHFVRFDSSECMVVCSCKKFEFTGIPCCHVLKVLEVRNIKELPPHYILKRWRKDAQSESPRENYGFEAVDEDPRFLLSKRYSMLYRTFYKIAAKAAENIEAYTYMESQCDQFIEQVELLLQAKLHDKSSLSTILKVQQPNLFPNEASNSETRRVSSKKIKNVDTRRQQQSPLQSNKKKKGRQGLPEPEEAEVPLRVDPPTISNDIPNHLRTPTSQFLATSHIMQAPYIAQQFGLSSLQGFPGISPFGQEPAPAPLQQPHLQQPPFHSGPQIPQAPPPDIQSLQFLSSNPQLGHQATDQSQYTIPVWDFL
ncbi:hypothetical protein DAI22_03g359400 [Oryza sativa Japonica Group]|nr:hypothetical protein DAI22_03g359400 [Oryza sativa Japonica Group]